MVDWIPLLQYIQKADKVVVVTCQSWEVKHLLAALEPQRILLSVTHRSRSQAMRLVDGPDKNY